MLCGFKNTNKQPWVVTPIPLPLSQVTVGLKYTDV